MSKKGKNSSKNLLKEQKKLLKKAAEIQRSVKQTCIHGTKKKSWLRNFREDNGIRMATCKECGSDVIVDENVIYDPSELKDALMVIDSAITVRLLGSERSDSKKHRLKPEAYDKLLKVRRNLGDFVDDLVEVIEAVNDDDYDEDENVFNPKKKKSGKKSSNKRLFKN